MQRVGTKTDLMKGITEMQLRFLGYAMRLQQLESVFVTGRVEGRCRKKLVDSLIKVVGGELSPAELLQMTFDRACWRSMVANVLEDTALRYGKVR